MGSTRSPHLSLSIGKRSILLLRRQIGYIASKGDASFETLKRAMLAAAATSSITVESFSCYKLEKSGMEEISRRMDYIRKISSI